MVSLPSILMRAGSRPRRSSASTSTDASTSASATVSPRIEITACKVVLLPSALASMVKPTGSTSGPASRSVATTLASSRRSPASALTSTAKMPRTVPSPKRAAISSSISRRSMRRVARSTAPTPRRRQARPSNSWTGTRTAAVTWARPIERRLASSSTLVTAGSVRSTTRSASRGTGSPAATSPLTCSSPVRWVPSRWRAPSITPCSGSVISSAVAAAARSRCLASTCSALTARRSSFIHDAGSVGRRGGTTSMAAVKLPMVSSCTATAR